MFDSFLYDQIVFDTPPLALDLSISDAISVIENSQIKSFLFITVNDSVLVVENRIVENPQAESISIDSSITFSEGLTVKNVQLSGISVNNNVSITEGISVIKIYSISTNEVVSVTENAVTRNTSLDTLVSDSLTSTETITIRPEYLIHRYDKSLSFDGISGYVESANSASLDIIGDISVEVWFVALEKKNQILVHKDYQYSITLNSANSIAWADSSDWNYSGFGFKNIGIELNVPTHLIVTKEGNVVRIYKDGVLKVSQIFGAALTTTVNPVYFGTYKNTGYYLHGGLDEARIYNRALSSIEAPEHYNGLFLDNSKLRGLWHFNEGSGTLAADSSGNGNIGTLYNGVTWINSMIPFFDSVAITESMVIVPSLAIVAEDIISIIDNIKDTSNLNIISYENMTITDISSVFDIILRTLVSDNVSVTENLNESYIYSYPFRKRIGLITSRNNLYYKNVGLYKN